MTRTEIYPADTIVPVYQPGDFVSDQDEEVLSSQQAVDKIDNFVDIVTQYGVADDEAGPLLADVDQLLEVVADNRDGLDLRSVFAGAAFTNLGIRSPGMVKNLLARERHQRMLNGLGISLDDSAIDELHGYFDRKDKVQKAGVMSSFASSGLLTLRSAMSAGILTETSATPGDFGDVTSLAELDDDDAGDSIDTLRGYLVDGTDSGQDNDLFYGNNGFFGVAIERGNEDINRPSHLPKVEIENRVRNTMMFVVAPGALDLSPRSDNGHKEDVVNGDIPPEAISYLLVDSENYDLAVEAFAQTPIRVVKVGSREVDLHQLSQGPYSVPDYQGAVRQIAATDGPVWCHITRLPVDTYPDAIPER